MRRRTKFLKTGGPTLWTPDQVSPNNYIVAADIEGISNGQDVNIIPARFGNDFTPIIYSNAGSYVASSSVNGLPAVRLDASNSEAYDMNFNASILGEIGSFFMWIVASSTQQQYGRCMAHLGGWTSSITFYETVFPFDSAYSKWITADDGFEWGNDNGFGPSIFYFLVSIESSADYSWLVDSHVNESSMTGISNKDLNYGGLGIGGSKNWLGADGNFDYFEYFDYVPYDASYWDGEILEFGLKIGSTVGDDITNFKEYFNRVYGVAIS